MKFAWASLPGFVSAVAVNDDAVLLSVSTVRESFGAGSGLSSLVDLAQEGSPRKAQQLLQQFAKNTLLRGEAVDETTKEKLKEIGAQLTNNTWMALEQAHRRDQALLNKHWGAIKTCGDTHRRNLEQDVDDFEVQQVRSHEMDMIKCRGLPNHTNPHHTALLQGQPEAEARAEESLEAAKKRLDFEYKHPDTELPDDYDTVAWMADTPFAIYRAEDGSYHRHFSHVSRRYNDESSYDYTNTLLVVKNKVCEACGMLDSFLGGLSKNRPNCEPTYSQKAVEPKCTTADESYIETDLDQWFDNLVEYADTNLELWQSLKKKCDAARSEYAEKDKVCDEEQEQYEQSFCAYRQGLHATCAEYQGCHILTEEKYKDLISDVLNAADSRKIDWKAIHKIACYIKVLISEGSNQERTLALENCESGNLNTLATILTGFNESNYLSIIIPEISGNVSCWDMDVPPLIDFKECDMSSVHQYPCTETWMRRYEGLESPSSCRKCADLSEHAQYSDNDYQDSDHYRLSDYGGGWIFVNEVSRSTTDIDDLVKIQPDGYFLPKYNMKGLRYNDVLIQRTSPNWCDSWGRQTSKWVEADGASMCVQADNDHVYCMSNHNDGHSWRQQPTSHFAALCNKNGVGACECWPYEEGLDNVCFAYGANATGPAKENKPAPRHVTIKPEEEDGSVVRVTFHGEEKTEVLRVGNYGSFLDGVGCGAATPVSYRVFVRCLGCVTERSDFHTKDGAQFVGAMEIRNGWKVPHWETYTFEAWFRSPLDTKYDRELLGGRMGLKLKYHGDCDGYQVHLGSTNAYSKTCFSADRFYHVAVTKKGDKVKVFVNGDEDTFYDEHGSIAPRVDLAVSFGGGFTDGGQLFNVRVWEVAREEAELKEHAAVTDAGKLDAAGLVHWWPLVDNVQDIVTGVSLKGPDVRYAPIWCSDLEATGMRVC